MTDSHRMLTLGIPRPPDDLQVSVDQWEPVRGIRFGGDDMSFLLGVIALLDLSQSEKAHLLTEYAARYHRALVRSKGDQGKANRAANAWVRAGCRGYLQINRSA